MVIWGGGGVILGGFNAKLSNIMQDTAKICTFLPKFTKNVQNCAKTSHFSPIKHLFLLKKTVKIDVSTYESVQCVGVPGSILCGF